MLYWNAAFGEAEFVLTCIKVYLCKLWIAVTKNGKGIITNTGICLYYVRQVEGKKGNRIYHLFS